MRHHFKQYCQTASVAAIMLTAVMQGTVQAADFNTSTVLACPNTPFCDNGGTVEPGAALNQDFRLILDDAKPVLINQNLTSTNNSGDIFVFDTGGSGDLTVDNAVTSSAGRVLFATNGAQTNARTLTLNGGIQETSGLVVNTGNSGAQTVSVIVDGASFDSGTTGMQVGDNDIIDLRGSIVASTDQTGYNLNNVVGSGSGNGSILRLTQQANDAEVSEATLAVSGFQSVDMVGSFAQDADHILGSLTSIGTLNLSDATSGNLTLAAIAASSVGTINNSNELDISANTSLTVTTLNLNDDGVLLTDADTTIDADTVSVSGTAGFGASTDVAFTGGSTVTITGSAGADTAAQNISAAGVADSLRINGGGAGANNYLFSGNLTDFETIQILGNDVEFTGSVTGVDDIDILGGSTLDLSGISGAAITVGNAIDVTDGTLNVSTAVIDGDINLDVADGALAGDLVFGSGDETLTLVGDGTPGATIANNINGGGHAGGDALNVAMDLSTDSVALTGTIINIETITATTGQLDLSGATATIENVVIGADGGINLTGQTVNGNLTVDVQGDLTGNVTFDASNNILTFNGDGSPQATFANNFDAGGQTTQDRLVVAMDASGDSLALTGNITGFEQVEINEGELDVSGASSLVVGTIEVNDGGAINTGAFTLTDDVTVNDGGAINGGVVNFGGGAQTLTITNATVGTQTTTANIVDAGGADILALTAGNAGTDLTLSGDITDFETINAAGTGTVTLGGAVTGVDDVNVTGGATLDITGVTGAALAVTNDVSIDASILEAGATTINGDLTMVAAADLANTPNLVVNGDLVFSGNTGGGVTHAENMSATNLTVNTTGEVELDGAVTSVTDLSVGANAILDLDGSLNTITSSTIDGTLDVTDLANAAGVFDVTATGTLLSDLDTILTGTVNADAGSTIANAVFGVGDDIFNITGTAGADTVNHTVDLGAGNNQMNVDGGGIGANGLTMNGSYSNVDTLNITANDVIADATFAGVDTLTVANGATLTAQSAIGTFTASTIDGTYDITALANQDGVLDVGATGALVTDNDTIINGDVTLAAGGNFGASTDVTFGTGDETLDITGTAGADTFDENIDAGLGDDVLLVDGGATAATFTGTIDGFETITIDSGITAFNNTITGTDVMSVENGATLDLSGYVPGSLTIANDITVTDGTLVSDAGLLLDTDLFLDYQNGDSSGDIAFDNNGHTVTIEGAGIGAGASESTLTGGTGTDALIANFNTGGTYTQGHAITGFETLTVTSGELDMDVAAAFTTVTVTDTLDILDAANLDATTSITVENGGTLLSDVNTIINTPDLIVDAGGSFGASSDIVMGTGDSTLDFTGTAGADVLATNLDGGTGTDVLILDSNGVGSDRLTANGTIAGFETITIDTGEVRLTGAVSDVLTANVDGSLEVTDLANFDATTAINVNSGGTFLTDIDTIINTATFSVDADGGLGTTTDMTFGTGDNDLVYNGDAAPETLATDINMGTGTDDITFDGGGGLGLTGTYSGVENLIIAANQVNFNAGSAINALDSTTLTAGDAVLDVSGLAAGLSSTLITLNTGTALVSDADSVITATTLNSNDDADLQGVIQLDTAGGTWTHNANAQASTLTGDVDGGDNSWVANISGTNILAIDGTLSDFDTLTLTGTMLDLNGAIEDFNTLTIDGALNAVDAANIGQVGDGDIILTNGATLTIDADTALFADLTLDDGAGFGASTDVTLLDNGTLSLTGTLGGATQIISQNINNISDLDMNIASGEVTFTGTLTDLDNVQLTSGVLNLDQATLAPDSVTVDGGTLDITGVGAFGEAVNGTMDLNNGATILTDGDTVLNFDQINVDENVSFGATTAMLLGADDTVLDFTGNAGVAEVYAFDIDGGAGADTLQVSDAGDVNNSSVFNGDITNIEDFTLTGATLAGTVTAATGANVIALDSTHITGTLNSGDGADTVTLTGINTISGTYDGGTPNDDVTINGGTTTVTGALNNVANLVYGGAATLNYDSAQSFAGAVDGGAGAAVLNVLNSGVTGAINMGADNDVLGSIASNGATSFDGAIDMGTGDDTITVNALAQATEVTFNDTITFDGAGNDALNLTQGTITLNQVAGAAGANDAALTIGDNTVVTFRDTVEVSTLNQESNQGMNFYIFDDTTHGQLVLSGNAGGNDTTLGADADEAVIFLTVPDANLLETGDVITLITDAGGGDLINQFTLDPAEDTVFITFSENTSAPAGTYSLNVDVNRDASVILGATNGNDTSNGGSNVVNVTQAMIDLTGGTDEFAAIRANLLSATTEAEARAIADTLVGNTTSGAVESNIQTADAVRNLSARRLNLRRNGPAAGVSTGEFDDDRTYLSHGTRVWSQGFASVADQDRRDGFAGYEAKTVGTAVGIDTTDMYDDGLIGVAFSYAKTDVDADNANNTETDIDSYQVTLYSGFDVAPSTYVNAMASYTYSQNEHVRSNVGGNPALNAKGEYDSQQGALRLETGHRFQLSDNVMFTPSFNADYARGKVDRYTETGAGNAGLTVDTDTYDHLDVGVDMQLAYSKEFADGTVFEPRFNVGYSYAAINDPVRTTSQFIAGGSTFTTEGMEPDEHTIHLGLGAGLYTAAGWQFSANVDVDLREEYIEGSGSIRAAKAFE